MTRQTKNLALVMMVKDEEIYSIKTFETVKEKIDTYVIMDTCSTDNTVSVIKEWCINNGKTLFIKEAVSFINFEISRNQLLDYADKVAQEPYFLLMDANDELKGEWKVLEEEILKLESQSPPDSINKSKNALLICQVWKYFGLTKYFNIRVVKNGAGWRFKGVVHEYIQSPIGGDHVKCPDSLFIYQDRENDGNKSAARYSRDYELLKNDHLQHPDNERSIFYLARTCDCLGLIEEGLYYHLLRAELEGTFVEERTSSLNTAGKHLFSLGRHHRAKEVLLRSFELLKRVEPLVLLAEYYINKKQLQIAYIYLLVACSLEYPTDAILFVDDFAYNYKRWHLMGIVGYYYGDKENGKSACLKAIEGDPTSTSVEMNMSNLKFYDDSPAPL